LAGSSQGTSSVGSSGTAAEGRGGLYRGGRSHRPAGRPGRAVRGAGFTAPRQRLPEPGPVGQSSEYDQANPPGCGAIWRITDMRHGLALFGLLASGAVAACGSSSSSTSTGLGFSFPPLSVGDGGSSSASSAGGSAGSGGGTLKGTLTLTG